MNGKEKMIDLVKGYNLPLQEKHTELFKKDLAMFEKDFEVTKNIHVLLILKQDCFL